MKHNWCFLKMLLIFSLLFFSCKSVIKNSYPQIHFYKDTIDLNVIDSSSLINVSFGYSNTGDDTLKILNVEPSCNCTVIKNYSKEILSGKDDSIPIRFMAESVPKGIFIRRIAVLSNSKEQISILILKGIKK